MLCTASSAEYRSWSVCRRQAAKYCCRTKRLCDIFTYHHNSVRAKFERCRNSHASTHLRRILPRPRHPAALSSVLRLFEVCRTAATSALNAPFFSTSVFRLRLTMSIVLSHDCDTSKSESGEAGNGCECEKDELRCENASNTCPRLRDAGTHQVDSTMCYDGELKPKESAQ